MEKQLGEFLDDKLMVWSTIIASILYVLFLCYQLCNRNKYKHIVEPVFFVMYFIALAYGLSFFATMVCGVADCSNEFKKFILPKMDFKFYLFATFAMIQYGFIGLLKMMKHDDIEGHHGRHIVDN